MTTLLSIPDALVAVMVATSTADERVADAELATISRIIEHLPVFRGYSPERVREVTSIVFELLEAEEGLDAIIGLVKASLPGDFNETAYALACDVAAADCDTPMAELRWLQMVRQDLGVGRLAAAAIERGARAHHLPLPDGGDVI